MESEPKSCDNFHGDLLSGTEIKTELEFVDQVKIEPEDDVWMEIEPQIDVCMENTQDTVVVWIKDELENCHKAELDGEEMTFGDMKVRALS